MLMISLECQYGEEELASFFDDLFGSSQVQEEVQKPAVQEETGMLFFKDGMYFIWSKPMQQPAPFYNGRLVH